MGRSRFEPNPEAGTPISVPGFKAQNRVGRILPLNRSAEQRLGKLSPPSQTVLVPAEIRDHPNASWTAVARREPRHRFRTGEEGRGKGKPSGARKRRGAALPAAVQDADVVGAVLFGSGVQSAPENSHPEPLSPEREQPLTTPLKSDLMEVVHRRGLILMNQSQHFS